MLKKNYTVYLYVSIKKYDLRMRFFFPMQSYQMHLNRVMEPHLLGLWVWSHLVEAHSSNSESPCFMDNIFLKLDRFGGVKSESSFTLPLILAVMSVNITFHPLISLEKHLR